jgi:hypothetical protein
VAIVDVTPAARTGFGIAGELLALPVPPVVILTSSTGRAGFGADLDGHRFIDKAGICAAVIARLTAVPRMSGAPDSSSACPSLGWAWPSRTHWPVVSS